MRRVIIGVWLVIMFAPVVSAGTGMSYNEREMENVVMNVGDSKTFEIRVYNETPDPAGIVVYSGLPFEFSESEFILGPWESRGVSCTIIPRQEGIYNGRITVRSVISSEGTSIGSVVSCSVHIEVGSASKPISYVENYLEIENKMERVKEMLDNYTLVYQSENDTESEQWDINIPDEESRDGISPAIVLIAILVVIGLYILYGKR